MSTAMAKPKVYGTGGIDAAVAARADGTCLGSAPRMTDASRADDAGGAPVVAMAQSRPGSRRSPASWCWAMSSRTGGGTGSCRGSPPATDSAVPERWAPAIVAVAAVRARRRARTDGRPSEPATLQGDTRLLGVFAAGDGTGHALFRLGDRGPVLVRSGEDIARDVTLVEVRPDGVRIRDHGEMRSLGLRTKAAAPRPARNSRARRVSPARRRPDTAGPSIGSTRSC